MSSKDQTQMDKTTAPRSYFNKKKNQCDNKLAQG